MSFSGKITRAMVEGKLLQRTGKFITNSLRKIPRKIDAIIGVISRRILQKSVEIIPRKILFITFQGDYTCNLKYITERLLQENFECDIVWSVRKAELKRKYTIPPEIRLVEQYSYDFFKEFASASIILVNSVEFLRKSISKKAGQILIQTWHGSLGIKKFGADDYHTSESWKKAAQHCGRITDYCISNSSFEDMVYRTTYWGKTEILQYGHPRNDIFFIKGEQYRETLKESIFSKYGITGDPKIVLYAPTFRDDLSFRYYEINFDRVLYTLRQRFGGNWIAFTRFHPTIRKMRKANFGFQSRNNFDVTDYRDIQELLCIADVGITDYSSWIYDFMLTMKPGFIFAVDIDNYYTERGFYYPLESTPFPIANNNDELITNIIGFNEQEYQKKIEAFLAEKGCIEDGHASERVVQKIKELIG